MLPVPGFPSCTHQVLAQRLFLNQSQSTRRKNTRKQIAEDYGIAYQKFIRHLNDHFYPKIKCLALEANLLTDDQLRLIRKIIQDDNMSKLRNICISVKQPRMNAWFLAQKRLLLFRKSPLTFEEIVTLPEVKIYSLKVNKVEQFWDKKCCPVLGKITETVWYSNREV